MKICSTWNYLNTCSRRVLIVTHHFKFAVNGFADKKSGCNTRVLFLTELVVSETQCITNQRFLIHSVLISLLNELLPWFCAWSVETLMDVLSNIDSDFHGNGNVWRCLAKFEASSWLKRIFLKICDSNVKFLYLN